MYELSYWNNGKKKTYWYQFHSLWAALLRAREIRECYGLATEVMDLETGVIIATIFVNGQPYVDESIPKNLQNLILLPIE